MSSNDFAVIFHWFITHGYLIMFLIMLIEGPVVTSIGAFAAKLGYFNIYAVFLISILGNIIPDIAYYALGYWGREKLVHRFGHHFGLTEARLEHLESLMHSHAIKTLLAVKLLPFAAIPGLTAAGFTKMPMRKYVTISLAIIFPTSLLFLLIGYYSGTAYAKISNEISNGFYLIGALILVFIVLSYIWKRIEIKISKSIEKI